MTGSTVDVDRSDEVLAAWTAEVKTGIVATQPSRPRVWNALDLHKSVQAEWLAAYRIPRSAVTYMVGAEGIGKSLFLMLLTAVVSTGRGFPEFGIPAGPPGVVVLVITEDDWSTAVRPRLELVGADLANVRVICAEPDGSGSPVFPEDMSTVHQSAAGAAVVIVDAWADTLPGNLSVRDPQQARQALHPWRELATRTGVAVLLSGHTNREKGANVRNAYGLTGELRKKARTTLLAQPDPDDDTVLLLGPEKTNVAATLPASRFRIEAAPVFEPGIYTDGTVPRLVWIGDAEQSARHLFAEAAGREADEHDDDRTETEQWLEDYLTENGATPRKAVLAAAAKEKFAERTVKRAASNLGVVSDSRGFPRTATWALPSRATSRDQVAHIPEPGLTGPTGGDLQKRRGPTGADAQSGQTGINGPTDLGDVQRRTCDHPGDPSKKCGRCVAEQIARQSTGETERTCCRVCLKPADSDNPAGLCGVLDADHRMGWITAQTGQPWPGEVA
ncbi:MAG: AAA family ATPase [Actinomycetota bacterium]|nr:AAA family ATPase [Actinomycetota bacterium]